MPAGEHERAEGHRPNAFDPRLTDAEVHVQAGNPEIELTVTVPVAASTLTALTDRAHREGREVESVIADALSRGIGRGSTGRPAHNEWRRHEPIVRHTCRMTWALSAFRHRSSYRGPHWKGAPVLCCGSAAHVERLLFDRVEKLDSECPALDAQASVFSGGPDAVRKGLVRTHVDHS